MIASLTDQGAELFEVAPFVLVVDRSESMGEAMDVVNRFVPELIETIEQIPEAFESVALGVIAFNDGAQVVRRLTWIDEEQTRPHFVAERRTSYVQFPGVDVGTVAVVRLQEFVEGGGYTDIELESDHIAMALEAERGWDLPTRAQLEKDLQR